MSVTKFPSKGLVTPDGQADEPAARREAAPQPVVSLKGYRQELTRKARAQARHDLRGKVKATSLNYVLLVVFFVGITALAYGHNYFDISDAARSGLVAASLAMLAWILHFIFLDTFLLLVSGMIVIFGGTMMFDVWTEMSVVLVGVVLTNMAMQWIGWLQ